MGRLSHRRGIVQLHHCDVCGGICGPEQPRHDTCAIFRNFHRTARPLFSAVVSVVRRESMAPLLARYDECRSIDALSEFLEQIRGLNRVQARPDALARLDDLALRADRLRLMSEYASFAEFRTNARSRFIDAIRGIRRSGLALHWFDRAQTPRELNQVLYSAKSALTDPRRQADPDRVWAIRLLLIENRMFAATREPSRAQEDGPISSVHPAPARASSA